MIDPKELRIGNLVHERVLGNVPVASLLRTHLEVDKNDDDNIYGLNYEFNILKHRMYH